MRRYRCSNCGNITRFDVVATVRTRSYYHFGIDGTLEIEESEELSRAVEEVTCRWCATGRFVEVVQAESETVTNEV
jgi:DNA-directed RNA polymerase subunit RPC12/RpoP